LSKNLILYDKFGAFIGLFSLPRNIFYCCPMSKMEI
jgi:hypothetical protein